MKLKPNKNWVRNVISITLKCVGGKKLEKESKLLTAFAAGCMAGNCAFLSMLPIFLKQIIFIIRYKNKNIYYP